MDQTTFDKRIEELKALVYHEGDNSELNWYIRGLADNHKRLVEKVYDGTADLKYCDLNWKYIVDDVLDHILSTRLAGMPEDPKQWKGKDAKINQLMTKITEIHNKMINKPTNPDRPTTLKSAHARIDELNLKIAEIMQKVYNLK
jgi:hypothetical protein